MKIGPSTVIIGVLMMLSGCASTKEVMYNVQVAAEQSGHAATIIQATERVLTRRLAATEVKDAHVSVVPTGTDTATMTVAIKNAEALETVQRILAEPFTFAILLEEPKESADEVEGSEWLPTGLDGTTLNWVEPIAFIDTEEVGVELQFSEQGRAILADLFQKNTGRTIGIFVRDLLVSSLQIGANAPLNHLVISGIPSHEIAEVFADDVNVGLFTTLTPLP